MIAYAWAALALAVLALVMTFALVLPATLQAAREMGGGGTTQPAAAVGAAIGGSIGGACGTIIAMALPICILVFFKRPNVIDSFERGATLP